jgi:hypothetical protein
MGILESLGPWGRRERSLAIRMAPFRVLTRAAEMKVGTSDEEVLAWLQAHDFTKKEGEVSRIVLNSPRGII